MLRSLGLPADACEGSRKEIHDPERRGTALQIDSIDCFCLHQQDTDNVPPLPVRDFVA
jgi:hypothetical protein